MKDNELRPLTSRDWGTPTPPGFRVARIALLFLFVLHFGGASLNLYRAIGRVASDHLQQFPWVSVGYPAAIAVIAALSLWWLRAERAAGALVGSILLAFYGV